MSEASVNVNIEHNASHRLERAKSALAFHSNAEGYESTDEVHGAVMAIFQAAVIQAKHEIREEIEDRYLEEMTEEVVNRLTPPSRHDV